MDVGGSAPQIVLRFIPACVEGHSPGSVDRGDPRLVQCFTDRRALQACGGDVAGVDRQCGGVQALQRLALRIAAVLEAEAAPLVAFTGQCDLCDPLGAAEAIAALDQLEHGGIAQFIDAEVSKWSAVIKRSGVVLE